MAVNPQPVGHHFVTAINNPPPINLTPTRSGKLVQIEMLPLKLLKNLAATVALAIK